MQITVKSTKLLKEGTNKNGKWQLWLVTDNKDIEYTTFDKKASHLTPGAVIEIGSIILEVKDDKENRSFKELTIISQPETESTNGKYKKDIEGMKYEYQLKARLQSLERASIEAQTAYIKIMDALCAGKVELDSEPVKEAIKWAMGKLGASIQSPEVKESIVQPDIEIQIKPGAVLDKLQSDSKEGTETSFANVGALRQWCKLEGIETPKFLEIVGCTEKDVPNINIPDAYQLVKEHIANRG